MNPLVELGHRMKVSMKKKKKKGQNRARQGRAFIERGRCALGGTGVRALAASWNCRGVEELICWTWAKCFKKCASSTNGPRKGRRDVASTGQWGKSGRRHAHVPRTVARTPPIHHHTDLSRLTRVRRHGTAAGKPVDVHPPSKAPL